MNVKKYILRSVHYAIRLAILLALAFLVLHLTGTLNTGGTTLFEALFMSARGAILIGILIILAGLYPQWAFSEVDIKASITDHREQIIKAFEQFDYVLVKDEYPQMVFRVKSVRRKIFMQFDDAITVTEEANYISLEGYKKEIVRIELKLNSLMNRNE